MQPHRSSSPSPCQAISGFDRPLWAEPCLGETRELEDPAPALKELFVLPGEPRSQLHQLPKNPLSELPVVKCKVGQCHPRGWRVRVRAQAGTAEPSRRSGHGRLQPVSGYWRKEKRRGRCRLRRWHAEGMTEDEWGRQDCC